MVLLDDTVTTWWYSRPKRDRGSTAQMAVLATLVALMFLQLVSTRADAATETPRVVAVHSSSPAQVSMILEVPEAQLNAGFAPEVSVTVDGSPVTTTVEPMASRDLSVGLVIDNSTDMTAEALEAAKSGATEFLLRLPEGASTMVVASGGDPRVVAPLSPGPADALSAVSALRPEGIRSTAAGTVLAAQELATAPPGPRLIVVYANGTDERGTSVEQLTRAVSQAQAVVNVVHTGAADDRWSQVIDDLGGVELRAAPTDLVQSFGRLAAGMDRQWILTFDAPGGLPAEAEVTVTTGDSQTSAAVTLPAADAGTGAEQSSGEEPDSRDMNPIVIVLSGLVLTLAAVLALIRRARQPTAVGSTAPSADVDVPRASHVTQVTGPPTPRESLTDPVHVESPVAPMRSRIGSKIAARARAAGNGQPADEGAKIVLAGSDNAVVNLTKNVMGPAAVHITGNPAARYFGVRSLGTSDDLVITLNPYEGIRPLGWDGGESTGFDVTATGSWRIEVLPLSAIATFSTHFNGSGDMVVRFDGEGSLAEIAGNNAGRYFFVRTFGPDGTDILVNTTQAYRGTSEIRCGPQFFAVQAVGPWAITVK
jgi:hypothetical protein